MRTRPKFMSGLVSCLLGSLAFLFLPTVPLQAAEPVSRSINSEWRFRALGEAGQPGVKDWHRAQVPGVVHTDLLSNGLIPEPFDRDNEFRLQWIGLTDWEYQTSFQMDAATLAHAHVDLVFEGLDTFADVYLNGHAILHTNNMFRRWRVSAKPSLTTGDNELRIVFYSPVK